MILNELKIRIASEEEVGCAVAIDNDACALYAAAGLALDIDPGHPFAVAEVARWREAAHGQRLVFACSETGEPVGFASFDLVDGRPYLDQLAVRCSFMKRGIGRGLVEHVKQWSAPAGELWLTTYDERVPWNQPWYERLGFERVRQEDCGRELQAKLAAEREVLPAPEGRIAMVFRHQRE